MKAFDLVALDKVNYLKLFKDYKADIIKAKIKCTCN